jgi:hypothetical protein
LFRIDLNDYLFFVLLFEFFNLLKLIEKQFLQSFGQTYHLSLALSINQFLVSISAYLFHLLETEYTVLNFNFTHCTVFENLLIF